MMISCFQWYALAAIRDCRQGDDTQRLLAFV